MTTKRKVEVFSAGCVVCDDAVELVKRVTGPKSEVTVHDMKDMTPAIVQVSPNRTCTPTRARKIGLLESISIPAMLMASVDTWLLAINTA